jgi:hypothetical protein
MSRQSDHLCVEILAIDAQPVASQSRVQDFLSRVAGEAREAGVSRVLVDARAVQGNLSTMERFDYAQALAKYLSGFKVAFIVRGQLRDPGQFGQTATINRGGHIGVFTDLEGAYEWLGVKSANPG